MILKNTHENRTRLFTCTVCEQQLPGALFYCHTEKPEMKGRRSYAIEHARPAPTVLKPYSRVAFKTRAIDPERPCRACRARASTRASIAKAKAREEAIRQAAIASAIKHNLPLDPQWIKRNNPRGSGTDPVLQAVGMAIAQAKQQLGKAMLMQAEERVAGSIVGTSDDQHPYYKWLTRLFEARIALYEDIRARRKADRDNPVVANDAQRTHMRAYISVEDERTLDWIADKVNFYRPVKRGKTYKGLAIVNPLRPLDASAEAKSVAMLREAWKPFKDATALTLRASRSAVRDKHRQGANMRSLRYGNRDERFTMEQYHMKRIECAQAAQREIERCLMHNVHPQAWKSPWTGEMRALRTWGPLVPPLIREELREMWVVLPEVVQNRARPFPMMRKVMKGARLYQQSHVLNADGTPLSDKLATELEVEA
jgi:hypothetical protein